MTEGWAWSSVLSAMSPPRGDATVARIGAESRFDATVRTLSRFCALGEPLVGDLLVGTRRGTTGSRFGC